MSSDDVRSSRRFERLFCPERQPWFVRAPARVLCHFLVRSTVLCTELLSRLREFGIRRAPRQAARVVLTGTFFADNWVEAHVRPLASAARCAHVGVVSDRPFVPIANATYVCPPRWLQALLGRVPARSLLFVITAVRRRATIVGGFHLLLNGLLALLVARAVGARAMWFCVGGWAEFVNGGIHGGNRIFNKVSRPDASLERLLTRALRQFDLILTMGTGARAYLRRHGVRAPIEVMPGGIDQQLFADGRGCPSFDLITVSRLVPVKRLDVFLQIVRRIVNKLPNLRAAVVGDGEELCRLLALSESLGLRENVSFVGRRHDVHRWLARARVYVLTSDSEGLALSLMEAMTAGLPAVVTDVGDLADLVHNGINGWCVAPGDVETFASRVYDLLADKTLYDCFAMAARQAAAAYDTQVMRRRWEDLLARWGIARVSPTARRTRIQRRGIPSRRQLWESSPRLTGRHGARILSAIPPHIWLGRWFRRNLRNVVRSQYWSRDETAAFQLGKLQELVALAYHRSPYYRRRFRALGFQPGDLRSLADLQRLPLLDSQVVRDDLFSLCTLQGPQPRADSVSTGGTGGQPLQLLINSDRSETEYAFLVASWQRIGYDLATPLAVFRGRPVAPDRRGLRHEYDPFLRHHHYDVFHLSDDNVRRYLEHISTIGPCFLHAYPSAVASLARYLRRAGLPAPANVRGIIAESEIVYPAQRRFVEATFGCRYFSCYGQTEKVVAAAECEHCTDYHVWPTYGYFELLDESERPVTAPGQRGEIVGTGFINRVVPLIRYRTGDWATYVSDHCGACGRNHPILRDIRGHRTQEMLVATDGSEISWTALNMHDDTFARVRQFQFYQDTPGQALLRIVPGAGFDDQSRQPIRQSLGRKLDGRLQFDIQLVDSIPLSPRGKAIYVDQRIATAGVGAERGP